MSARTHEDGPLRIMVITVGLASQLQQRVVESVNCMNWLTSISHLDQHISSTRRPGFGPQVRAANACVVFVDFQSWPDEAVETTRYLAETFGHHVVVIAVAAHTSAELILTAMRAGCTEFLALPAQDTSLDDLLHRLATRWTALAGTARNDGSLLAIMGVKGGVGATSIATQLALALAQQHHKRVLLVDSHAEFGHVCLQLGMQNDRYFFADLVQNVARLDSELLRGLVARHPSGLEILASPAGSEAPSALDPGSVARTLDFLRSEYDFVLVDCDRTHADLLRTIVSSAQRVYFIATPEISSIRNLSRFVERLTHLDEAADRLHTVLNRVGTPVAIPTEQVQRTLRAPAAYTFVEAPALTRSQNLGQPLDAKAAPEFIAVINQWAATLAGVSDPPSRPAAKPAGLRALFAQRAPLQGQGA